MPTLTDTTKHPTSPMGDRRERAVPCSTCRSSTWNICGRCDRHCTDVITDAEVDAMIEGRMPVQWTRGGIPANGVIVERLGQRHGAHWLLVASTQRIGVVATVATSSLRRAS